MIDNKIQCEFKPYLNLISDKVKMVHF